MLFLPVEEEVRIILVEHKDTLFICLYIVDSGVGSAVYQESENVEQAYVTEDEDTLEDLTPRFLLNLFSKSGISNAQVKKLGIFLEVPEHTVTQISNANPNEPAVQAMNVCLKWKDQHERMDKKTAYNKLDSALSFIKLGRVAKYLTGGKRPISQFSGGKIFKVLLSVIIILF